MWWKVVGVKGFEPSTSRSRTVRTTRLCYTPKRRSLCRTIEQDAPAAADSAGVAALLVLVLDMATFADGLAGQEGLTRSPAGLVTSMAPAAPRTDGDRCVHDRPL